MFSYELGTSTNQQLTTNSSLLRRVRLCDVAEVCWSAQTPEAEYEARDAPRHRLKLVTRFPLAPRTLRPVSNSMLEPNCAISLQRLFELLDYNPRTGAFRWHTKRRGCRPGTPAGSKDNGGYIRIRLDDTFYKAHRLAWFYVYGSWPEGSLRHVDGNRSNNAINNLVLSDADPADPRPAEAGLAALKITREQERRAGEAAATSARKAAEKRRALREKQKQLIKEFVRASDQAARIKA